MTDARKTRKKPQTQSEAVKQSVTPALTLTPARGAVSLQSRRVKALVYGPTGVGKTWALAKRKRVAYLSLEVQGYDSIEASNPDALVVTTGHVSGTAPVIKTLEEFGAVIDAIEAGLLPEEIDTIVVDGATELQAMMVRRLSQGSDMSQRKWGTLARKGEGIMSRLRDLPYHVLVTARLQTVEGSDGKTRYLPLVKGQLKDDIGGFFSCVAYMYAKQETPDGPDDDGVRRYWLLGGDDRYGAKGYRGLHGVMAADVDALIDYATGKMEAADILLADAPLPDDNTARARPEGAVAGRRTFE